MFRVEKQVSDLAEAKVQEFIKNGVRPGTARARAERFRVAETKRRNDWITENVGLD